MTRDIDIRNMTIRDYQDVHNLWLSTPGMGLNDLDDSREGIEKYLKRNPATCFIALKKGHVIGVILAGHDGRRGFIHHAAVAAEERKQGVGTSLLKAALVALRAENITKVALVVFKKNTIGNEFWEQRGFSVRDDLNYRNQALTELVRIDT